ncbi:hypothetical protein SAMN05878482_101853 [Peribacillus simplex]|uniref:Uncharacterized protein n=1 Tax=Peribacillus simplex TaxID=1478 RepID=A0A9X8R417_9BACI|nr:hypothetical protein [Peribacillus simplex]SIQ29195.1 hypothetical protein SAMN05878482_101853 [Peribacillus simplex]
MLSSFGVDIDSVDGFGRITIEGSKDLIKVLQQIELKEWKPEDLLPYTKEGEYYASKYSIYLLKELQDGIHIAHEINISATLDYLNSFEF